MIRKISIALLVLSFLQTGGRVVYAESEGNNQRQLRILEPADEVQRLDPAFEMIMNKLDGDLKHILSSPVRLTPRGTAITGLSILGTFFLLNEDEEYLDHIAGSNNGSSSYSMGRFRVLARNVPSTTAGLYLLGYFLDDKSLKSSSLEGLEAVAITALITASSGYVIGHKSPQDSTSSDSFQPFDRYRSMPDMNSSLIFSIASVYAYEKPAFQAFLYYGIAAGAAYSQLHFRESWPSDVFLGSVLGTAIGRTIASRSRKGGEDDVTLLPVLEHNGHAAIGLKVELKL